MALMDDPSDNKDFIKALTYLGKGPFNIGMPGGADLNVGAGPAPAPGVNVGTFGQRLGVGGPAESGAVGPGGSAGSSGSDTLALLQKFLTAGGKSADFLSKLQGNDLGTRGDAGGGSLSDFLRGSVAGGTSNEELDVLRGLFGGTGTVPSDVPGSLGQFDLGGSLSDVLRSPFSTGPSAIPFSGGTGAGTTGGVPGTAESVGGAGDLVGGLGAGASGAGALAAILGAIAAATGEKDLGTAASALGGAGTAAGTAGSLTSALGSTGALAGAEGAAATGTAGAGALGGAGLGALGAGVGAAASPVAAVLLASLIAGLFDKGPDSFGTLLQPAPDPYVMFGEKLGNTLGTENTGLQGLYGALPSVNSQQQLQQLLDSFKATEAGRIGGYGAGSDPFSVPGLPGAGGSKHEWGQNADFSVPTDQLNQAIQGLLGYLPATSPEGTMPGSQLWNTEMTNLDRTRARNTGLNLDQLATMSPEDQAATMALFPENIAMPGASDAWTQYMQSLQPRPQAAPVQSAAVSPAPPPADPFAMTDPYQDWLARQGAAA